METEIARARFSPDFVDEIRNNVDRLVPELQLAPGEAELGLAHLLGELLSLKGSRERRHAEAQALHEYIVWLADETARSRALQPRGGRKTAPRRRRLPPSRQRFQ
jgi:hypothetical protein